MLFADLELAARIEHAECHLLSDSAAAVRRRRQGADVFVEPIAGGLATYTGQGSPLNKIAGLGFAGDVDAAELERIEQAFEQRGAAIQVELPTLAEPSIGPLLSERGYRYMGVENVLGCRLPWERLKQAERSLRSTSELEISLSGTGELETWLDVVASGFANPDAEGVPATEEVPRDVLDSAMADMASGDEHIRYLARFRGTPAGGASLRLCEGIAQLCGAATLPDWRRRGIQSAFLARRLGDASAAGCDIAVVTTQPASKSQENVQRQGFELLYSRAILVRDARR